jgi:hypothetical protein
VSDVYESFMVNCACEDDTRLCAQVPRLDGKRSILMMASRAILCRVQNDGTLETHRPYQRGCSATYPGVNSMLTSNTYETHFPYLPESTIPPMFRNVLFPVWASVLLPWSMTAVRCKTAGVTVETRRHLRTASWSS